MTRSSAVVRRAVALRACGFRLLRAWAAIRWRIRQAATIVTVRVRWPENIGGLAGESLEGEDRVHVG
jgi:hypothetical protein